MGWRSTHYRPGQQLAWVSRVGCKRLTGLVGADWGTRLKCPRGVESRAGGCRSFGLHWIVGRLVSRAIVDSWELLQGSWIL